MYTLGMVWMRGIVDMIEIVYKEDSFFDEWLQGVEWCIWYARYVSEKWYRRNDVLEDFLCIKVIVFRDGMVGMKGIVYKG